MAKVIEGSFDAKGLKFAIVASRWNNFVVSKLIEGALDALKRHGVEDDDVVLSYCPGAFELPLAVQKFAQSGKYDAVIALGAVIRGATPHFNYIASEVSKGIASANLKTGVPCAFGVITTDTIEQAVERAGSKSGNKGFEAAMSAIETANLLKRAKDEGAL